MNQKTTLTPIKIGILRGKDVLVYDYHALEAFRILAEENGRLHKRINQLELELVDKMQPTSFWSKLFCKKLN